MPFIFYSSYLDIVSNTETWFIMQPAGSKNMSWLKSRALNMNFDLSKSDYKAIENIGAGRDKFIYLCCWSLYVNMPWWYSVNLQYTVQYHIIFNLWCHLPDQCVVHPGSSVDVAYSQSLIPLHYRYCTEEYYLWDHFTVLRKRSIYIQMNVKITISGKKTKKKPSSHVCSFQTYYLLTLWGSKGWLVPMWV